MSDAFAIGTVTAALTHLLSSQLVSVLAGGPVTSRPLDKARDPVNLGNQLNLFLYAVTPNAALRNQPLPSPRAGEAATPPLALDLHYLLTAFGSDDDHTEPNSHVLLGHAMRVLHEFPVLSQDELTAALPKSDIGRQLERVRITPLALTVEEITKLWTTFQTQYRVSTAYQVSVVLIESTNPARSAPPVLRRGPNDRGVASVPRAESTLPTLERLTLAPDRQAAEVPSTLTVHGRALTGAQRVRLASARAGIDVQLPIDAGAGANAFAISIPDGDDALPAGLYALTAEVMQPGETTARTSNALALPIAPTLRSLSPQNAPAAAPITLNLTVKPALGPLQRASVLFGDLELLLPERTAPQTAVTVRVPAQTPGTYLVRVRVDGIDSQSVVRAGTPPVLQFSPSHLVTVT